MITDDWPVNVLINIFRCFWSLCPSLASCTAQPHNMYRTTCTAQPHNMYRTTCTAQHVPHNMHRTTCTAQPHNMHRTTAQHVPHNMHRTTQYEWKVLLTLRFWWLLLCIYNRLLLTGRHGMKIRLHWKVVARFRYKESCHMFYIMYIRNYIFA